MTDILFKAYSQPAMAISASGMRVETDHKVLYRIAENEEPICLNVVGKNYKVIQNVDLFSAIEDGLQDVLGHNKCHTDAMSQNGRICMRDYNFPNFTFTSPEGKEVRFRMIVVNGFGGSAIKVYIGAIDYFCMNGMIIGDYTSKYARHSSRLELSQFTKHVASSVDTFLLHKEFINMLADRAIKNESKVFEFLNDNFSGQLSKKILNRYKLECLNRGQQTLWSLYSAMTNYASHEELAPLRHTAIDHAANTMLQREVTIAKLVREDVFMELAT